MNRKDQIAEVLGLPKDEPGTVNIMVYRGTVYGVYDQYEKARQAANQRFGENALLCLDVSILRQKVQ